MFGFFDSCSAHKGNNSGKRWRTLERCFVPEGDSPRFRIISFSCWSSSTSLIKTTFLMMLIF